MGQWHQDTGGRDRWKKEGPARGQEDRVQTAREEGEIYGLRVRKEQRGGTCPGKMSTEKRKAERNAKSIHRMKSGEER